MPSRVLERAVAADDEAVRALLRRTPMDGSIRLTFEREPDVALSAAIEGDRHHMFVAREGGCITGVCSRAVRRVWINGAPARIGYLGLLRSDRPAVTVRHLLEGGFAACHSTRQPDETPFDFTSILTDNLPARRLLERGLPGLPRYVPIGELRTLVLPVGRGFALEASGVRIEKGSFLGAPGIASLLQRQYVQYQLAPQWTEADLESDEITRNLAIDDFLVAIRGDAVVGCAALWDQGTFRQSVVRGYAPWLAKARPLVNAWNRLRREPRLPVAGERLRLATISHFAVDDDDPAVALALIEGIRKSAAGRSLELLAMGLAAERPLFTMLRARLRARILESILYAVCYDGEDLTGLDGRTPHVEVATL